MISLKEGSLGSRSGLSDWLIAPNKFLNNGFYDAELNNNEYCLAYSSIMNQKEVEANVLSFLEQKLWIILII